MAPSAWPCWPLVAVTGTVPARAPKTSSIASASPRSPSGVPLPCALTRSTSSGGVPASASARAMAAAFIAPSGRGADMWWASLVSP